jgi:hypothetical protein
MENVERSGEDLELKALLEGLAHTLGQALAEEAIDAHARRCVAVLTPSPRRWRYWRSCTAAVAASIVIAMFSYWYCSEKNPPNSFVEAPPAKEVPAGKLLGHPVPGPGNNRVTFLLPPMPRPAWVAVLQIRDGQHQLWTRSDEDCLEVRPDHAKTDAGVPLGMEFLRGERHPTRMLFLWTEKPCGQILRLALKDGAVHSFDDTAQDRLLHEIDIAIRKSGNRLLWFRFETIAPLTAP